MYNINFVIGVAYIALMVGMTCTHVGELPGSCEPYPWWLPITVLIFCEFPFVIGYLAGKGEKT